MKTTKGTKIHNVRFYNLPPRSINCLAYNNQTGKLALSRNDGSIEIWDLSFVPFLEKIIPDRMNSSVESLVWSRQRLFSAGLSGEITEWDLMRLKGRHSQLVTGSAIWCLDISADKKQIAAGTEEGYLNLYDIDEAVLNYSKLFDKQDGRILCCKFDETGDFIVTGSLDGIRIWSTKSGHAIRKMTLGRTEAKRETVVWCLQVLKGFIIIAGDSRGQVTVWDGKLGTQIESHQALKADVLTIAVNENEDNFMCAGIDPVIKVYALTNIKKEDQILKKWVKFLQRSVHDHDVKALACAGHRIISGGIDGYLGMSSYSKLQQSGISKHGPFLRSPCISISTSERTILMRYNKYLELWRLGKALNQMELADEDEVKDNRKIYSLEQGPVKLVSLKGINDEYIVCSALSPDGKFLVYSTPNFIRAFVLGNKDGKMSLTRIREISEEFGPSLLIAFSHDSRQIFLAKDTNRVDVFNVLSNDEIDHSETVDTSRTIKDLIHLMTISNCGRYLVVGGTCRTTSVWVKQKKNTWKHYLNLPRYVAPTTAIAVHPNVPKLAATFSDGKIYIYDLEEMRFISSTNKKFVPNSETHCAKSVVFDPRNEDSIILHNETTLYVLKASEDVPKKNKKLDEDETTVRLRLKFQKTYEHFVHLAWLSNDEMVVVGVNPVTLIEQLPPSLRQKKFGAS